MPVILRNNATNIEIDVSAALKHYVNKGDFDVILENTGNGAPIVYVVMRSKAITENFIKLDWRDISEPIVSSAEELRDLILSWNIQQAIITNVRKVECSTESCILLDVNEARKMATIYNNSCQNLCVKYGADASIDSFSLKIAPSDYLELFSPCYLGRIDGFWEIEDLAGDAMVTEIT